MISIRILIPLCGCLFSLKTVAQTCSCAQNFQFFEEKIRINYPGFRDKVTDQSRGEFDRFTARHRQLAEQAGSDTACFRILSDWKKWFRDGHVQLNRTAAQADPVEVRKKYANTEKIDLTETGARAYLDQAGRLSAEGIWRNAEGSYRVAITRQPGDWREFAASILRADSVYWIPGQVKFELKNTDRADVFAVHYYMRDHSMQTDTATLTDGVLHIAKTGDWYREYPGQPVKKPAPSIVYKLNRLDSVTLLLVLPTMNENVRHQLDSLMKANRDLFLQTPNLVIDCRNNGGGSDITYRLVSPLLYTHRTTRYRYQIWATRDNAGKYADLQKNNNYPWVYRTYGGWMKRRILRNEGKFIGKKGLAKNGKLKKQPFPQRVAVLINGNCASSCESFVEEARQSEKVTLIGVNTAGVSDYGNLHTLPLPCYGFEMRYPTTRSTAIDVGKGIDNIGFAPDVRLGPETKDWVEFARQYLHGQIQK